MNEQPKRFRVATNQPRNQTLRTHALCAVLTHMRWCFLLIPVFNMLRTFRNIACKVLV